VIALSDYDAASAKPNMANLPGYNDSSIIVDPLPRLPRLCTMRHPPCAVLYLVLGLTGCGPGRPML